MQKERLAGELALPECVLRLVRISSECALSWNSFTGPGQRKCVMKIAPGHCLETDDADEAAARVEDTATALAMVEVRGDLNYVRAIVGMQAFDFPTAGVHSSAAWIADGKDRFAQTQSLTRADGGRDATRQFRYLQDAQIPGDVGLRKLCVPEQVLAPHSDCFGVTRDVARSQESVGRDQHRRSIRNAPMSGGLDPVHRVIRGGK